MEPRPYVFSVQEFVKMHEIGIFPEESVRVELLAGAVCVMHAHDAPHEAAVLKLSEVLKALVKNHAIVSVQNRIQLHERSLPRPDFALLVPHAADHSEQYPSPSHCLLLIEVANASLAYDRHEKLQQYAKANIPEAWVVDTTEQAIEQYIQPRCGQYDQLKRHRLGDRMQATELPYVELDIEQVFPQSETSAKGEA
jgi:Uma2 family endonuclease